MPNLTPKALHNRESKWYTVPSAPQLTWPPKKPPTLQDMERDMKQWAANKDDHKKLLHEGRVEEAARATAVVAEVEFKLAEATHAKSHLKSENKRLEQRRTIDVHNLQRVAAELARTNIMLRTSEAEIKRLMAVVEKQGYEMAAMASRATLLEKELRAQHATSVQSAEHFAAEALKADSRLDEAKRQAINDVRDLQEHVEAEAARVREQVAAAAVAAHVKRVEELGARMLRRIRHRGVGLAFESWLGSVVAARTARQEETMRGTMTEVEELRREKEILETRLAASERAVEEWQAEAEEAADAAEAAQAALESSQEKADKVLVRVLTEHDVERNDWHASVGERERVANAACAEIAEKLAAERQARIEQVAGQIVRRILHRDLSVGFMSWAEAASARREALEKLREVANRLRAPDKSHAFDAWRNDLVATREAEAARVQAAAKAVREGNIAQLYTRLQESEAQLAKLRRRERDALAPTSKYSKDARMRRMQEEQNDKRRLAAWGKDAADPGAPPASEPPATPIRPSPGKYTKSTRLKRMQEEREEKRRRAEEGSQAS